MERGREFAESGKQFAESGRHLAEESRSFTQTAVDAAQTSGQQVIDKVRERVPGMDGETAGKGDGATRETAEEVKGPSKRTSA